MNRIFGLVSLRYLEWQRKAKHGEAIPKIPVSSLKGVARSSTFLFYINKNGYFLSSDEIAPYIFVLAYGCVYPILRFTHDCNRPRTHQTEWRGLRPKCVQLTVKIKLLSRKPDVNPSSPRAVSFNKVNPIKSPFSQLTSKSPGCHLHLSCFGEDPSSSGWHLFFVGCRNHCWEPAWTKPPQFLNPEAWLYF